MSVEINPLQEAFKALAAFQAELPKVGKDKTANAGSYSYRYTDLATLTQTVMPLLTKHGFSFITFGRLTDGGGYELVGMLCHESGVTIEGALPIYGRQPQEIGSAVSYARRYLLSSMTGVVSDEDDDGKAAVKASRTKSEPAKDWGPIADTAEMMTTVEDVRALWKQEDVGSAPKAVQDRIKAHTETLKAEESA